MRTAFERLLPGLLFFMLAMPAVAVADDSATDTLWVEGMELPDCDDIGLDLLLESMPGVESADVDFESGQTTVRYDPARVNREQFIAEVVNRGFSVPWVTDVFVVTGWEVAERDAPAVRLLVGSLEGVAEIEVDEESGRTVVRYDPSKLDRDAVVADILNLDWNMTLVADVDGARP